MTTDEYADWLRAAQFFTTEEIISNFLKIDRVSRKVYDQSIRECRSEVAKFLRFNIPKMATISTEELKDAISTHTKLLSLLPEVHKKKAVDSNYKFFLSTSVACSRLEGHQMRMKVEFISDSELKRARKKCDKAIKKLRPAIQAARKAAAVG
jgi:hypothetical protein